MMMVIYKDSFDSASEKSLLLHVRQGDTAKYQLHLLKQDHS